MEAPQIGFPHSGECMKKLVLSLAAMAFTASLLACHLPSYLENQSLGTIKNFGRELTKSGFKITFLVRELVNKVIEIDDTCKNSYLTAETFLLKNGKIIHLAYTSEDICDGGNSYGVVLDANLRPLASIQDTDFYCPVE